MRLGEFISANVEPILVEWESFARSIWPPSAAVDPAELRNSAAEILRAIVADMTTAQTPREQSEKSMGRGGAGAGGGAESARLDRASAVHRAGRVGSGLALSAVVAEYRALRASVLRLWRASARRPDLHDLDDLTRFNEATDQSPALAVDSFTRRVDTARKMFLAISATTCATARRHHPHREAGEGQPPRSGGAARTARADHGQRQRDLHGLVVVGRTPLCARPSIRSRSSSQSRPDRVFL